MNDILQRFSWTRFGRVMLRARLEGDLFLNLSDRLNHGQAPFVFELAIDCADFAAENAIDSNAEIGRFAIHGATAADDQVGVPEQVQAVDSFLRNNDL